MKKFTLTLFVTLLVGLQALLAQGTRVTGIVSDESGAPLAGVTVFVEGTQRGSTTLGDGAYAINAPANGTLNFSFMGMVTEIVPVNNRTTINVVLKSDTQIIDDVIVVAFGTAKREAFTGSAASVGAEALAKRTSTNVVNSLAGQLPGLQIRSANGQPGEGSTMRIRGVSSLSAGSDPLIVVDGSPYPASLSTINPADIESLTVLKDAASNALYGSRAANGVIMITTKRGKTNQALITVDAKVGVSTRNTVKYDVITDPGEYYEAVYFGLHNYYYNAMGNTSAEAEVRSNAMLMDLLRYNVFNTGNEALIVNGKLNPNATLGNIVTHGGQEYLLTPDNWEKEAFRNGIRQDYNVTISSGSETGSLLMSFGYLDEKGLVERSDYKRFTARMNAEDKVKNWLRIGGSFAYANSRAETPGNAYGGSAAGSGNVFSFTTRLAPIYPLYIRDGLGNIRYDERGMKRYDYGDGSNGGFTRPVLGQSNALSAVLLDETSNSQNQFNMNGFIETTLAEGLKFTLRGSSNIWERRELDYTNPYYGQYASSEGTILRRHRRFVSINTTPTLTYTKQLNQHRFDVMASYDYNDYRTYYLTGSKNHMFHPDIMELNNAVNVANAASAATKYTTEGILGRIQYEYDGKYFAHASYRRDGSSRFHKDNRWGNFWSAGAAWLLNKEDFMADTSHWIDMLKVKASIGSVGNDNIGENRFRDVYEITADSEGSASTAFVSKGNPNITWETVSDMNVGIEFDLFKRRLSGQIEYYNRTTYDLLFFRGFPESIGYSGRYENIGDMRNSGFEISLSGVAVQSRDLVLRLSANITSNKNKILKLPEEQIRERGGIPTGDKWWEEGGSRYQYYLREYAGVNEHGQATWTRDVTTNGVTEKVTTTDYSAATQRPTGKEASPKFYGGFSTAVEFKGFDLSVLFDYQIGGWVYDSGYASAMSVPATSGIGYWIHKDVWNAWSPTNTSSNIPRYQYNDSNTNGSSDRFLVKASYLNLQSINLGYAIPSKLTQKIGVRSVRVYCSAENLTYWSKRKGIDPRQSYTGAVADYIYPSARTISGGIQLSF